MKTLDEVIKALEICNKPDIQRLCKDCVYGGDECGLDNLQKDALHYLKKLQDFYKICNTGGVLEPDPKTVEIGSCVEIKWHEPNPALTWDELKTMEGKPVWIEGSAFAGGFWTIITGFGDSGNADYIFFLGDQYWREDMQDAEDGLSWQAYRKERE